MARLVAAFGSSHSPMLASRVEDWQSGFLARDKARQFVDFDGNACDYDSCWRARRRMRWSGSRPSTWRDAMARRWRRWRGCATTWRRRRLDALIVVGDDQEELFHHDNMPAIGIYYGETIRGRLPYQKEIVRRPTIPAMRRWRAI